MNNESINSFSNGTASGKKLLRPQGYVDAEIAYPVNYFLFNGRKSRQLERKPGREETFCLQRGRKKLC